MSDDAKLGWGQYLMVFCPPFHTSGAAVCALAGPCILDLSGCAPRRSWLRPLAGVAEAEAGTERVPLRGFLDTSLVLLRAGVLLPCRADIADHLTLRRKDVRSQQDKNLSSHCSTRASHDARG